MVSNTSGIGRVCPCSYPQARRCQEWTRKRINPLQRKQPRRIAMLHISPIARERIQAQGFCGLSDATYAQINYPLRLSPAIMMVWVAVGTALTSAPILWALVPFTALGAILTGHPFDVLYNHGLRYLTGAPKLPRYGFRRRLAFAVATTMMSLAAWGFQADVPL